MSPAERLALYERLTAFYDRLAAIYAETERQVTQKVRL